MENKLIHTHTHRGTSDCNTHTHTHTHTHRNFRPRVFKRAVLYTAKHNCLPSTHRCLAQILPGLFAFPFGSFPQIKDGHLAVKSKPEGLPTGPSQTAGVDKVALKIRGVASRPELQGPGRAEPGGPRTLHQNASLDPSATFHEQKGFVQTDAKSRYQTCRILVLRGLIHPKSF